MNITQEIKRRKERKINHKERAKRRLELPTWTKVQRLAVTQLMVLAGAALAAGSYVLFQVPFKLAAGGVSGLGIIVNHYTGFPVGVFFLVANLPLLVWGYFQLGKWPFVCSSLVAVLTFSFGADAFNHFLPLAIHPYPITHDKLLAAIYSGIAYGLGMGLIYRAGSSIGGTSIPARIWHRKTGFPMSQVVMYTDVAVIALAGIVFEWELALLAFLTLLLSGMVSDFVIEGASQFRTAMIITNQPEIIRWGLMKELGQGVTMWDSTGGYTGQKRTMVYCMVRRSQVGDLKHAMARLDPDAFMVIGVVQQAWGGFGCRSLRQE
ncbi:YitT family protein [Desulfoplanes sp.]